MPWMQLRVNSSRQHAPAVEQALLANNCLAVTLEDNADQPIFEPELGETPLWQETRVTGLFEAETDTATLLSRVNSHVQNNTGMPLDSAAWHLLEDKDWEREWMSHYHPIQCADNLWICPSWTPPPNPKAVNLMLDPGLAFGTGTHPTTFLCLQWLAQQPLSGCSAIDYGCGSGILGIAALLLGADNVCGTDIDPQAILATRENVQRNGLLSTQFPVSFPERCPSTPVDLILANILAGPLVDLAPSLCKLLKPGGKICLSGILASQEQSLVSAYESDIGIDNVATKEEWICVTGTKRHLT